MALEVLVTAETYVRYADNKWYLYGMSLYRLEKGARSTCAEG